MGNILLAMWNAENIRGKHIGKVCNKKRRSYVLFSERFSKKTAQSWIGKER